MGRFWDSEANKFTVYGALFGLLFPIIATLLDAMLNAELLSWDAIVQVQKSNPLLWIIDSAPFWLGIFARFAGMRQDHLKRLIRESGRDPNTLPQRTADAGQFAGTLTNFGLALIAVVLLGLGMWIQNIIATQLAPLAKTDIPTERAISGNVGQGSVALAQGEDNQRTANAAIADRTPPTPAATNPPVVLVLPTPVRPTTTLEADMVFSETVTMASAAMPVTPTPQPAVAAPTVDPAMQQVRLGYLATNRDCLFFSQVAALVWPQQAGVAVALQAFADSDALFAALAEADNPRRIDLTLCFLDPENRPYFQQYVSIIQVMGKTFWKGPNYSLMAVAHTRAAYLIKSKQPCLYSLIRNQNYSNLQVELLEPATWITENATSITTWLACQPS